MSKTTESPLKYVECAVTMAEVPREISLTLTISNCIFHCHHCHSPYLQQDIGKPLQRDLDALILRYSGMITCVCLMGEGQNMVQLEHALSMIRSRGLKTCLYSGNESIEPFIRQLPQLDYIKLGPYEEELGGQNKPTTNQRFYRVSAGELIDETWMFQGKRDENDH